MAPVVLPFPNPANSGQYAEDLVADLGAPLTHDNVAVTSAWVQSESATFPGWNGLGTELALPGAVPDQSNPAVYDYPSLQEGLDAAKDMMLGLPPQSTPDAPQFVADLRTGKASAATLVTDVYNSHWAGTSVPDAYDASTIASKLSSKGFTVAGSGAELTSAVFPGGAWDPLNWHGPTFSASGQPQAGAGPTTGQAATAALGATGIAGDVKKIAFVGIVAIAGLGLIVLGVHQAANGGQPRQQASPLDAAKLAAVA